MRLSDLIPDRQSLITRDYWWKRANLGMPAPEFEPVPALAAMRQPTNPIDLPQQQSLLRRQMKRAGAAQANAPQSSSGAPSQIQAQNQAILSQDPAYYWNYAGGTVPPDDTAMPSDLPNASQGSNGQQPGSGGNAPQQPVMGGGESALAEQDSEAQQQANPQAVRKNVVRLTAPEIDWSYAVIERIDPDTLKTVLIPFDLGKLVLQHDASQDLELQPSDMITIFSQADIHVPIADQTTLVRLEGEFVHSGTYSAVPGETLRALVKRAGGLTPNAYLYGSVFTRESTRVIQQRRMDESIHSMILQMERGNLSLAASPVSTAQDLAGVNAAQASQRDLVTELQKIRASGRIVFAFDADTTGIDSIPDIPLENGDSFLIPSVPSTVNAVGAVFNQNSFLYKPQARLATYLQLAGGPNTDADRKRMFIVRANGAVVSRESIKGPWGNEFYHLKLSPGDTIVVPDKTIKASALRGLLDWSQVFSQMMFGAVAASVIF
jgi:protein involved in polysaccharide export with SLBB domain